MATQPALSQVHVDQPLTIISRAYMQRNEQFVSGKVFPEIKSDHKSDLYYTYDKGPWFRDEAEIRAPGTESAGGGYELGTERYECLVRSFHKNVTYQDVANADSVLDLFKDATEFVSQRILMAQEVDFANTFFKTGVWDNELDGASHTKWSDHTASDPINDLENAKTTVLEETGQMPNVLVLGHNTWIKLKHHPDIIDRLKYTSSEVPDERTIGRLVEIDKIVVARGTRNKGKEGKANDFEFIYGNSALLAYTPSSPSTRTPSAGYRFRWTGVSQTGSAATTIGVKRIDDPLRDSVRVESQEAWDNKVFGSDLGYFFNNIVDDTVS